MALASSGSLWPLLCSSAPGMGHAGRKGVQPATVDLTCTSFWTSKCRKLLHTRLSWGCFLPGLGLLAGWLWDRHACPRTERDRGRWPRPQRSAFVRGARLPSFAAGVPGDASLLVRDTNCFSALLSVTEERARECEDAVDLLRFWGSFSFVACLGEAELAGASKVRGVGCSKSIGSF